MVELHPLEFRREKFDFRRTYVMGVVNTTPDSFSDGNRWLDTPSALTRGVDLKAAGADLIDVGGESTRPGATPVPAREEIARVVPVIRALRDVAVVSIDTYKSDVAAAALDAGAEVVNDVSGGTLDPELLRVTARSRAYLILGHLRGSPTDMNEHARYKDVVQEVRDELARRIEAAVAAGNSRSRLLIDPGLGFAKTAEHSLTLLARLRELHVLGLPVVVGASRKSFLGRVTGREVGAREVATAAADAVAIINGAHIVRVHDVAGQRDAVLVADAIARACPEHGRGACPEHGRGAG
jgi:dihydropteroate synthase